MEPNLHMRPDVVLARMLGAWSPSGYGEKGLVIGTRHRLSDEEDIIACIG
jgi:hypothetical protein